MKTPEKILFFHKVEGYKIGGTKSEMLKGDFGENKREWGFVLKNIYKPFEIKEILDGSEKSPCLGFVTGKSFLNLREFMEIRNYIKDKNFLLLGPGTPCFVKPDFCFTKTNGKIFKDGKIALLTRAWETLDYGIKYLTKKGYKIKYGISLGKSLLPFRDFFDIIPTLFEEDVEIIVCINETGILIELPSFEMEKPVIFLEGGIFLFEEESDFKDYLEKIDMLLPDKSIYELMRKNINIVYHWKDLVEILRIY